MAPGRGENPQAPHPGEERGRHGEHPAEARNVDIGALGEKELTALKLHWQEGRRWQQPGARGLINRIDRRLAQLEKDRVMGETKDEPEKPASVSAAEQHTAEVDAVLPPDAGTVPETFEMPAGPSATPDVVADVVDRDALPASARQTRPHPQYPFLPEGAEVADASFEVVDETEKVPSPTEAPLAPGTETTSTHGQSAEDESLEERIARAEATYRRSLYELSPEASDEELQQRMREARVRRLGLPENADNEYIARAETQWAEELAALPKISDPSDERQLAPYYAFLHVEPGSGYRAIEQAIAVARFEQRGVLAPITAEVSSEQESSGEQAGAAVTSEEEQTHSERPSVETGSTESGVAEAPITAEGTEQIVPPVPAETTTGREPETAPTETREQTALRLINGALSGAGLRERFSLGKERGVLEQFQKAIRKGEALPEDDTILWGSIAAIYGRRVERGDHPDHAIAAAESYREFLRRQGMPWPAEKNVLLLDALARHDSPESALQLYHDIRGVAESMTQVTEGAEGPVRSPFADAIGEAWLGKLKEQIHATEQREDRAHPDAEELGRLQSVVDGPALPETLTDRLQAATETIELLSGRWGRTGRGFERAHEAERPTTLSQRRGTYARALQSQSRIFGRTSQEELERVRSEYQTAIKEEVAAKVAEIKASINRLPDGSPVSPEGQSEVEAALVDIVLSSRFEEEKALRESMRSSTEKTAATRFKQFWKKHPNARMAVGAALFGATTASAATGNILAAGIFQSMRTVISGASMTMTTEAIWEKSRERWGKTKKLTRTEVADLSDEELERRIAAHTIASANFASGYYEKALGRGLTVEMLNAEHRRRANEALATEVQQMREAGRSTDEIAEALLLHSMNNEIGLHAALEKRKMENRKDAVKKWSVAIGTGLVAGALTGALGAARVARAAEAATSREAAGHAAGVARRSLLERITDGGGHHPDVQPAGATAAEHVGQTVEQTGGAAQGGNVVEAATLSSAADAHDATRSGVETYAGQMKDAVIQKGEGIEHALRRQLEAMPEKFGFHGDAADKAAVHEWSGGEAHRIALREGLAAADGSEQRVIFDTAHPARFVLNADGHINSGDAETYAYVPSAEHAEPLVADTAGGAMPDATATMPAGETVSAAAEQPIPDATPAGTPDADIEAYNRASLQQIYEKFDDHPIELSEKGKTALSEFRGLVANIQKENPDGIRALRKALFEQPARNAMNQKTMEAFLDQQEGGSQDVAKQLAKSLTKLFKAIPANEIRRDDTIGKVMNRMAEALDAPHRTMA